MGYNCLAIDQRSRVPISTYQNETMMNFALSKGASTEMLEGEKDIKTMKKRFFDKSGKKAILWGSSC